jgi:amino acid adenylation domain-containing protein
MLEDSEAPVLVTEGRLPELPKGRARIVHLDEKDQAWASDADARLVGRAAGDDLAYLIYTSGSTGKPKGVEISHHALLNFLCSMGREPGFGPDDVLVAVTTLSFDIAGLELFLPLISGGKVVIASREVASDGGRLGELLAASGATFLQATPATWRLLLESGWKGRQDPALNRGRLTALCGGEAWGAELAEQLLERCERLYNVYGPTETTIWSTMARVEAGRPPSIGRPLANTEVYVLDRRLQPVPVGAAGELYIGGAGLARGYRKRPALTAERFLPSPFGAGQRLYRTGDLARFRSDGQLEYLGRVDQQVKVRGFRIEPGEVEAALLRQPGISRAAVVARDAGQGDRRLVAYLVAEGDAPEVSQLKTELRGQLPEYMVPSAIMFLDGFPLTPNGKLDRKALPAPEPAAGGSAGREPQTPVELELARIWREVLGLERVSLEADFFEAGGHSLLGTRLAARVREVMGVELPLRAFFQARTLESMAALVEEERSLPQLAPLQSRLAAGGIRREPSFSQSRLWFYDQVRPDSRAFHLALALRLEGELDADALLRSLNEVVRRHEVLRSVFLEEEGEPVQVVLPSLTLEPLRRDLRGLSGKELEEAISALIREEAARRFELADGPLLRAALARLAEREHLLVLTFHEIVADQWSAALLMRELESLYPAFVAGGHSALPVAAPFQHAAQTERERRRRRGGEMARQLRYWRWRLQGIVPTELASDRPRPAQRSFQGATVHFRVPVKLRDALASLAAQQGSGTELSMTAAFAALIGLHAGRRGIALGIETADRREAESESAIGPFANTLVLRLDASGEPSLRALMTRVKEMTREADDNAEVPFQVLVEELRPRRDLSRHPFFQVLFSYVGGWTAPRLPGLQATLLDVDGGGSRNDLRLLVREDEGGLRCGLEYDTGLFERSTVERLTGHFCRLLEAVVGAPDLPVSGLPLTSGEERRALASGWEEARRDFAREACVQDLFQAQVQRAPEAVAIELGALRLTYEELDRRANQLARRLHGLGVGPRTICGVCCERSPDLVLALLGVLKAGAAFLPLDPNSPQARLDLMLRNARADVLITQERVMGALGAGLATLSAGTVLLDSGRPLIASNPDTAPPPTARPEDLACVIYDAAPDRGADGVMIEHRALVNQLAALHRDYGVGPADVVLQLATPSSAAFPGEVLGPLCAGARLVLPETGRDGDPYTLLQTLTNHSVTCLLGSLPLVSLPRTGREFLRLRLVLTSGDDRQREDGRRLGEELGCHVAHRFGVPECLMAVARRASGSSRAGSIVLEGRAEANTRLYVLDAAQRELPAGQPGELYVAGESVARGYLGRPALTAERFLPDPFGPEPGARMYRTGEMVRRLSDGNLEILGPPDGRFGAAGKADPPLASAGQLRLLPRTRVEEGVARIWKEVLGLAEVGVRDDFFDLGGHSMLAVRVIAAVDREFGRRLPLASFFEAEATIESHSALLEHLRGGSSPLVVKARPSGSRPPLFFIFSDEGALLSLRHFLPALGSEQPVYGLLPEREGRRFDRRRGVEELSRGLLRVVRRIQPAGPYHICGHSLGGLLAYDLARQLGASGETIAFLGVVDALTPAATAHWLRMRMNPRARLARQIRRGLREGIVKLWEIADRETRAAVARIAASRRPVPLEEFDTDGALAVGMAYRPYGYRGRMVVFSTETSAVASEGSDLGWAQAHDGPLECVHLPGDHLTMLQPPQVKEAAESLAARLHKAQRRGSEGELKAS